VKGCGFRFIRTVSLRVPRSQKEVSLLPPLFPSPIALPFHLPHSRSLTFPLSLSLSLLPPSLPPSGLEDVRAAQARIQARRRGIVFSKEHSIVKIHINYIRALTFENFCQVVISAFFVDDRHVSYSHIHMHIYIYAYIHMYTCIHVYMYMYIHMHMHMYMCVYMCV